MEDLKLITIVPALPPQTSGVGDYAFFLANALNTNNNIQSLFLKPDDSLAIHSAPNIQYISISKDKNKFFKELDRIGNNPLFLHYVGYGYSKKGCPFWLLEGIKKWKIKYSGSRLIILFHELYANGKFWESAFWLHRLQKNISMSLFKLSDGCITTGDVTFNILKNSNPSKNIFSMPVFSTVGELKKNPDYEKKDNVMVLFGSKERRAELIQSSGGLLMKWVEILGIEKIIEIGPERERGLNEIVKSEQMGILSAERISQIMQRSKFGAIQYPWALLPKSTIFSAYASHGVTPLVLGNHFLNQVSDELKVGEHFLTNPESRIDNMVLKKVAENAFNWYNKHNLKRHTELLSKLLKDKKI